MKKLYIALDGGKKLSLGDIDTFTRKEFRLRTVDKNQFQARISMGIDENGNNYSLHSVYLESLRTSSNSFSYLDCMVEARGRRLFLVIKNGGRTIWKENFSSIPRKKIIRLFLILAGSVIILSALILSLLLIDFSPRSSSSSGRDGKTANAMESSSAAQTMVVQPNTTIPERTVENPVTSSQVDKEADTAVSEKTSGFIDEPLAEPEKTLSDSKSAVDGDANIPPKTDTSVPRTPDFTKINSHDLVLYFTPNSAVIGEETEKSLQKVLEFLLEYPGLSVRITGHCAIAGTEAGRKEISVLRAQNVFAWLKDRGWQPETSPRVTGEAGNYPLTMDPEKQELNRRVEIELSE